MPPTLIWMNIVLNWMSENENKSGKRAQIHAGVLCVKLNAGIASLYWTTLKWIWMTQIEISVPVNEIERLKFKKNHGNDTAQKAQKIPWIRAREREFECCFDENDRENLY